MAKIVIIEDDEPIARMYEFALKKAGLEVTVSLSSKQGLEQVTHTKPDLLLLDLMMPEMTGQEILQKIRATDWGKEMLVIVLSNLSQQEAKLEMGKPGFDGYAVKAYFTPKQLVEKVVQTLKEAGKLPAEWTPAA